MHKTPILLVLLVLVGLTSTGFGYTTKIPASKAIDIDMKTLEVKNNTTIIKFEVQTGENASDVSASIIQFNISSLNISDTDIGILVLRVANVTKSSNATNLVVLMPMGSDWDEKSSYLGLIANMEPILSLIQKKDMSQMEVSTNDGEVFDVSKILMEAKTKGDKISFLLMAFSDKNYRVEFKSTNSDANPSLLVMPYPFMENLTTNIASPVSTLINSKEMNKGASTGIINGTAPKKEQINESAHGIGK
jgi:hypothetical protein